MESFDSQTTTKGTPSWPTLLFITGVSGAVSFPTIKYDEDKSALKIIQMELRNLLISCTFTF